MECFQQCKMGLCEIKSYILMKRYIVDDKSPASFLASGWPSFSDMAAQGTVKQKQDFAHGMVRTEVVCAKVRSKIKTRGWCE